MKKLSLVTSFLILMLCTTAAFSATDPANKLPTTTEAVEPLTAEEAEVMWNRINEIKDMDKSDLSREERKELRKEVRAIKKEMRERDTGGIFISTGAIIIILLLIIIL